MSFTMFGSTNQPAAQPAKNSGMAVAKNPNVNLRSLRVQPRHQEREDLVQPDRAGDHDSDRERDLQAQVERARDRREDDRRCSLPCASATRVDRLLDGVPDEDVGEPPARRRLPTTIAIARDEQALAQLDQVRARATSASRGSRAAILHGGHGRQTALAGVGALRGQASARWSRGVVATSPVASRRRLVGLSSSGRTSLFRIFIDCPRLRARAGSLGAPNSSRMTTRMISACQPVKPCQHRCSSISAVMVRPVYLVARGLRASTSRTDDPASAVAGERRPPPTRRRAARASVGRDDRDEAGQPGDEALEAVAVREPQRHPQAAVDLGRCDESAR